MLADGFFIHDEYTAKVDSVQQIIEYAKTSGMNEALAGAEKELETLLLNQPNTQHKTEKETAKSLSAAATERTRIITQHDAWRAQQVTKRTKAMSEINRIKELKEVKIREEEERHRAQIEAMTNDLDHCIENQQTIIDKSNEDEEQRGNLVDEDVHHINELIKHNFADGEEVREAAPAATTAPAKPPVATLTSEMLTPEVVAKHLAADQANLAGLTQQQGENIMNSMFSLFQSLVQQQQQQQQQRQPEMQQQQAAATAGGSNGQPTTAPQPPTPQQPQQQQGEKGGAEQEVEISEDESESGAEETMTLVAHRNKLKKEIREKAAAAKGGGKGATLKTK